MTGQTETVDGAEFGVLGSDAESEEFNRYHLLIVVWKKGGGRSLPVIPTRSWDEGLAYPLSRG